MNPAVPERQSDVKTSELGCGTAREAMLEPVESSAHRIELTRIMRFRVETKVRHQGITGLQIVHHQLTITLTGTRS
jgi:hypothetical protein